jgi:hypothetical protein
MGEIAVHPEEDK